MIDLAPQITTPRQPDSRVKRRLRRPRPWYQRGWLRLQAQFSRVHPPVLIVVACLLALPVGAGLLSVHLLHP
jgi:hypothetical protein